MKAEIFTAPDCTYCVAAKQLLDKLGVAYQERNVADADVLADFRERLPRVRSVPQIFIDDEHVGGFEDLQLRVDRGDFETD